MTKEELKLQRVLDEQVNPVLAQHYGGANIVEYADCVAWIRMTGACGTCPSAQETIENVIKSAFQKAMPEVKDVQLDTSVSEEMLDMAKKILNKEI